MALSDHADALRLTHLAELKQQLETLRQMIRKWPVGSPEREALADNIGELVGRVIALNEEMEG